MLAGTLPDASIPAAQTLLQRHDAAGCQFDRLVYDLCDGMAEPSGCVECLVPANVRNETPMRTKRLTVS